MDLILISSDKMKVILDKNDMKNLNISADELDYQKSETKRAIWEILDTAKRRTGFDTDRCKLCIQVFTSPDGGCEIFITKNPLPSPRQKTDSQFQRCSLHTKALKEGIYIHLNFEELLELCKRLDNTSFLFESSLYLKSRNQYILLLHFTPPCKDISGHSESGIPQFVYSYGVIFPVDTVYAASVEEHCKEIISDNATSVIANL